MNDDSASNSAYLLYDSTSLEIRQVGFGHKDDHGAGLEVLAISHEQAVDFLSGKTRLSEFIIDKTDDVPSLKQVTIKPIKPNFWQLVDAERPISSGIFDDAEKNIQHVTIDEKTNAGFKVTINGGIKNVVLYITMKNDPNYLIKAIDLYDTAIETRTFEQIPFSVDLDTDYSIYVKYDAI